MIIKITAGTEEVIYAIIMQASKLSLIVLGAFMVVLTGCMVNPVTLQSEFNIVSEERENNIGRQAHPEIIKQFGYYENEELQRYVNEVGQKLVAVCKRKDITYHFAVLDTPMENAFAVPGGYIYITRGLLAYLNSEAELAGVLGHEIGHVVGRDSANQISQSMLAQFAVLAGVAAPGGADVAQATGMLLNSVMMGFGREKEYIADEQGVAYMNKAGYDPEQMASFQKNLSRITQGPIGDQVYNSTHPDMMNRIERSTAQSKVMLAMNNAMQQINNGPQAGVPGRAAKGQILSDRFKDYLEGLAYGPKENLRHIKIYTAQEGDTFTLIAKKTFGSEQQAKLLAEINGMPVTMQLVAGYKVKTIL
jgi:predicted Zn-dependent protease